MATKIGIISEGPIDHALLSALLERIARVRANFSWPTVPDDVGDIIPLRKRGHGGVLETVRRLVAYLDANPPTGHAFFVILLDRRTRPVHARVRRLIRTKRFFIMGTAIQEIEAWWLADRRNTHAWLGLADRRDERGETVEYWKKGYNAERDPHPKRTLDRLTQIAPGVDQRYGEGNTELAREFASDYWQAAADLDGIERGCPKGFAPFCADATQTLRHEKAKQGRLF